MSTTITPVHPAYPRTDSTSWVVMVVGHPSVAYFADTGVMSYTRFLRSVGYSPVVVAIHDYDGGAR